MGPSEKAGEAGGWLPKTGWKNEEREWKKGNENRKKYKHCGKRTRQGRLCAAILVGVNICCSACQGSIYRDELTPGPLVEYWWGHGYRGADRAACVCVNPNLMQQSKGEESWRKQKRWRTENVGGWVVKLFLVLSLLFLKLLSLNALWLGHLWEIKQQTSKKQTNQRARPSFYDDLVHVIASKLWLMDTDKP